MMNNHSEEWKDITGCNALYQVSNLGNVRSLDRTDKLGRLHHGKILSQHWDGRYLSVGIKRNGEFSTYRVHRLVAEAFVPNPNNLPEVNHKDEDRYNNCSTNLEWCTNEYNNNYGTRLERLREYSKNISKGVVCYDKKGNTMTFDSTRQAALCINPNKLSSAITAINHCLKGKTKTAYGYKWFYRKKCKLFFCSDIHGGYTSLQQALILAGFDENNINHKLIVLGDIFDRLDENIEVYEYLKHLTTIGRAVVTTGNHHKFLIDFLEGSMNPFNYLHNGLDTTLADFWHRTRPFESWCLVDKQCDITQESYAEWAKICRDDINNEYPELLPWLKSLPRFFESENYIGVHAAIDTKVKDWHKPHCYKHNLRDWDALEFDDGSFFGSEIINTDKTVVIGHFGTQQLREMYDIQDGDDPYGILYREDGKVIAIDTTTALSHRVNVLVVEDEFI